MAGVFDGTSEEDDDGQSPGIRVAGALTGDGEDAPEEEQAPQAEQPQGTVDGSGQSYLTPAGADNNDGQPAPAENDAPVSADTKAYMTPITPPTLAKPADYADHSADTAAMTAQKVQEAKENTKPSIWRRLGAGLAAGSIAYGTRNTDAAIRAADDINNAPLNSAQHRWALQEAPIQAKLNADAAADAATLNANVNTEQSNRLAEQQYGLQERGQIDAARADDYNAKATARNNQITAFTPDDPANPYAGGTGTTADGRTVKGVAPPDAWIQRWVKTPDGQLATQQMTLKQRGAAADQIGLKGQDRQDFLANGKISARTPRQASAEEIALGQARAAFIKENGRPPQTLDEQNQVAQAARGTLTGGGDGPNTPGTAIAQSISEKNAWINKHQLQSDLYGDKDPNTGKETLLHPKGTFIADDGHEMSAKEVQDQLELFRNKLNNSYVMRKSGTMVNEKGETVTNRFSRNPQAAPPTADNSRQPPPRPQGAPPNFVPFTDSTGHDHWISPDKLAAAKKRDPGLRTY